VTRVAGTIDNVNELSSCCIPYLPNATSLREDLELRTQHDGHTERFSALSHVRLQSMMEQEVPPDMLQQALVSTMHVNASRRLFLTKASTFGISHNTLKVGDEIWLLAGAKTPFVLRPRQDGTYELIGEAYVDGLMFGELWPEDEDVPVDITLT